MLISFEGIEGSGKSTQMAFVGRYLTDRGIPCRITREPGGTRIGKKIRAILLDPDSRGMAPLTELMLYMADRAQHLAELVRPQLEQGLTVLCDRCIDATIVYQGCARGLGAGFVRDLHRMVFSGLYPDLTFVLDLPPETGLTRAWRQIEQGRRKMDETRFEEERSAFHRRVRNGYLALAREEPGRIRVVDASMSRKAVTDQIAAGLTAFLADASQP